jgi:hypothetical protein
MIDILIRVTVAIRPALSFDRYERARKIELPEEDLFLREDANQIAQLFPGLSPKLKNRLVLASLERRRLLQYMKDYHERFKADLATKAPRGEPTEAVTFKGKDPESASIISHTSSNFSTSRILGDDPLVPDDASDTSSLSSFYMSPRFGIPPLPEEVERNLRICIACFLLLPIPNEKVWR